MRYLIFSILSITILFTGCTKDTTNPNSVGDYRAQFDAIPIDRYYDNDILSENNLEISGTWKFESSSGGFHGGGYTPDFDLLLLKPNAIFGIVRNDSLLATGKIELSQGSGQRLAFTFDSDSTDLSTNLMFDPYKFPTVINDTLTLLSDCCDRFDEILVKE